ncbi:hypothetical protein HYPSUDRAFT_201414 [Hypholoma sublateritium FD-334 SS-4]|uniref:DUF6593 domain-containing protein n=1 Tax=Hypholoma sublateritium (strain FD-334 SS-4) TaxID=945553 RepID=A0A0D2L863_HYPSF|nr:hypothetical protein HYPSUDRAFT_201414 [Hypholoma sublateritium FD-334 SS-4]
MALKLGLPLFLEDKSGRLSGAEYVDMYGRMRLLLTRSVHDEDETVYHIYDQTEDSAHRNTPAITLKFGSRHALGTITFRGYPPKDMAQYISQVNDVAGPTLRRFFASDGREYRWGWRKVEGEEWTCTNSDAEVVADYSLKHPGGYHDPPSSGGAMLTVTEEFSYLATEMLASVSIMRHILRYNLFNSAAVYE